MNIAMAVLVAAAQTISFLGLWDLAVSVARSNGRFSPELFFGITIYYGTIWIVSLFVVCGLVALLVPKTLIRWSTICIGLLAWLTWLAPSFDSRPFAMPAFFALGAGILILGTGVAIPFLTQSAARLAARQSNGEQSSAGNPLPAE